MAPQFFYERDGAPHGPFLATRMRELAAAGKILASDLIWKEGTDLKVPATRVGNLFPLPRPDSPRNPGSQPEVPPIAPLATASKDETNVRPHVSMGATGTPGYGFGTTRPQEKTERKKRVISITGGTMMGQDGTSVQFKKKCATCGWEDSCRSTALIRVGSTRVTFFCRPCRKSRCVQMQGIMG